MTSSSDLHTFQSAVGLHVFMVDGSRIYDVDDETYAQCVQGVVPRSLISARGEPFIDESEDPAWTVPVAELVDGYNVARRETLNARVKDVIARARQAETTPRIVSDQA